MTELICCTGLNCPHRDACSRHTDPPKQCLNWMDPPPQVIAGEVCPLFVPGIGYGDSCTPKESIKRDG